MPGREFIAATGDKGRSRVPRMLSMQRGRAPAHPQPALYAPQANTTPSCFSQYMRLGSIFLDTGL